MNDIDLGPSITSAESVTTPAVQPNFHESQLTRFNLYLSESAGPDCNFWLGLTRIGERLPQQVLSSPSVAAMLDDAATRGITDEAPVMLSDTTQDPCQYLYLLPLPEGEFRDRSLWIHNILQTIQNWNPQSIGIYLHPTMVAGSEARELLRSMLTALIETTGIKNYFLLVGSHGLNNLINTALQVKHELETSDREVVVFH